MHLSTIEPTLAPTHGNRIGSTFVIGDRMQNQAEVGFDVSTRIVGAFVGSLLMGLAIACGDAKPSPTPEPTVAARAVVTGTVTYRERIALRPDAVVEVKLLDISRADAPSTTIGEQIIENPGQVPVSFEIEYNPEEIDQRFSYVVRATITEGGKLSFTTDTRYPVITRDSPTHLDLVLVKVGQ